MARRLMMLGAVLVMLGTNDLKERFSVNAGDIAHSLERLVRAIRAISADTSGAANDVPLQRAERTVNTSECVGVSGRRPVGCSS